MSNCDPTIVSNHFFDPGVDLKKLGSIKGPLMDPDNKQSDATTSKVRRLLWFNDDNHGAGYHNEKNISDKIYPNARSNLFCHFIFHNSNFILFIVKFCSLLSTKSLLSSTFKLSIILSFYAGRIKLSLKRILILLRRRTMMSKTIKTTMKKRRTRLFMSLLLHIILIIMIMMTDMTLAMTTNFNISTTTTNQHRRLSSSINSPVGSTSSSAEYFYAQDKLSDAQVEQFLQSLHQNQTSSSINGLRNRISNGYQQNLPSPSLRQHLTHVQQSYSLLTSPKSNHSSQLIHSSASDNISTAKYLQRPNGSSSNPIFNSSLSNNQSMDEKYYDLSQWLRPVYIAPKRSSSMDHISNQSEILLFGSDSIGNFSANETEFDSETLRSSSSSSLLLNVTFELKDEQWVAPIIALSTLNMLVIVGFECFVIYRACRTCPSRRHLFLGQMLLLGLFLSSAMGLTFVPKPTWLSCMMIRSGLGISFAIVYASLLVKTVFLLSLHQGVYLSAEYQALLMFFIISTQVAIDVQWLGHTRSSIVIDYWDGFGQAVYRCDHSTHHLLWSLSYIILLIVILAIMTFRIRGYRENHGEALFLGIVALSQVFVWLVWIAGTLTSTPHYRDGFTAFGVVGNATLVFMIMFLPKGRQLAAVGGRDVLAGHSGTAGVLDRIDQLSIASSPSMYTPSFLHIKTGGENFVPLTKSTGYHYRNSMGYTGRSSTTTAAANAAYHLYQKFHHGTANTLTASPNAVPDGTGVGTNSTTITTSHPRTISNSFSSHAIFHFQQHQPSAAEQRNSQDHKNDDDDEDPNYSNLSNIFTTSSTVAVTSSNDGSKTSPLSENISSHSSGSASGSTGHHHQKNNIQSGNRAPSIPKSKRPTSNHTNNQGSQLKSPNDPAAISSSLSQLLPRNAGGGFFYLQPPPLPPPQSDHSIISSSTSSTLTNTTATPMTSSTTPVGPLYHHNQTSRSWRQSCYTSNFGVNHRHYYPGPKSGSYHPSLPPVPSTPTGSGLATPIGHMPPQLISPTGNEDHHHSSGTVNFQAGNATTNGSNGFYFGQFDHPTQSQQQTPTSNGPQQQNLKYFRGQHF